MIEQIIGLIIMALFFSFIVILAMIVSQSNEESGKQIQNEECKVNKRFKNAYTIDDCPETGDTHYTDDLPPYGNRKKSKRKS